MISYLRTLRATDWYILGEHPSGVSLLRNIRAKIKIKTFSVLSHIVPVKHWNPVPLEKWKEGEGEFSIPMLEPCWGLQTMQAYPVSNITKPYLTTNKQNKNYPPPHILMINQNKRRTWWGYQCSTRYFMRKNQFNHFNWLIIFHYKQQQTTNINV